MNDELPSESTRRSSSHSTIRSSGKAYNSNSSITLSSIKTKKSKSTTLKNTTIKVKSPVIHRKSGLKKNRQSLATEKKRTVLHSTLKKNRSATILQNLNSSDDEIQMDYGEQRTTRPDSNLPVTTPNNIKTEESANNHDDSFDSSQTIDIDRVQPKKKQNKSTIKSKQDVLKYFIIISTGELKCKLCKDSSKLFAKSSMESDSNLRSHLGRIHDLDGFLYPSQRKKPLPKEKSITFNQKQLLNAAAIEAIIRDSHAFNLFRKPGMQHFLSIAVPGYRGPHRKTVIKRLKPMYKQRRADIREKFSHITDVSLSADVWKSNNKSHFIGLTAQYYDDEYQYHTMVIAFRRFIGKHSADRLERFIEKEINKLNIKSKVCAITTDNGSDIRSATQRLSKFGIKVSCILHNFNLITQNGLWLFKIPKKISTSLKINNTINATKITSRFDDNSSDDDRDLIMNDNDTSDTISYYSDSSNSTEDENSSIDSTTASSSSDESELSSFENNSDEDDATSLSSPFTEEEHVIKEASANITILLSKIHILLKRIRKLVSTILKSSILNRYVDKQIKLKEEDVNKQSTEEQKKIRLKKFTLDMKIRWNSTLAMLSRFLCHSSIINSLTHDPTSIIGLKTRQCRTLRKLSFSSIDWTILKSLEYVLLPFDQATTALSNRHRSSLSTSYGAIHAIKGFLKAKENAPLTLENILKKHLLSTFDYYYEKHVTDEQNIVTLVSAFLDPTTYRYVSINDRKKAEAILLDENSIVHSKINLQTTSSSSSSPSSQAKNSTSNIKEEKEDSSNALYNLYKLCGLSCNKTSSNSHNWTVKEELCHYLSTVSENQTFSEYWNNNKTRLPILSSIVRRYHIISATSISCESAFSISGFVQNKYRASLAPEKLRYSMILRN